jgi:hypothetical protein
MKRALVVLALLFSPPTWAQEPTSGAGTQSVPDRQSDRMFELEQQKLQIERQKLVLEDKKASLQRDQNLITALSTTIPLFVALVTVAWSFYNLRKSSEAQFLIKVAEITLSAENPQASVNKARLITHLFAGQMPHEFTMKLKSVDPSSFGGFLPRVRSDFIRFLSEHPDQRFKFIEDWLKVFPGDTWIEPLR